MDQKMIDLAVAVAPAKLDKFLADATRYFKIDTAVSVAKDSNGYPIVRFTGDETQLKRFVVEMYAVNHAYAHLPFEEKLSRTLDDLGLPPWEEICSDAD